MKLKLTLGFLILMTALLLLGIAAAGENAMTEEKIVIRVKTDDFELAETDISDLAVGESETIVTESGKTIDLLRTEDGVELYIDGELQDLDFGGGAMHPQHRVLHEAVEFDCESDTDCECDHDFVFFSDDADFELLHEIDGDNEGFHERIELICDVEEQCEKRVWISDGEDLDIDELHIAGEGHKVIKIHKQKAASGED